MVGIVAMRGPCIACCSSGIAVMCGQCSVGAAVQRVVQRLRMRGIGHGWRPRSRDGYLRPAVHVRCLPCVCETVGGMTRRCPLSMRVGLVSAAARHEAMLPAAR